MRSILASPLTNPTREREAQLRARHERLPGSAWVTHLAWTEGSGADDPLRGVVRLGLEGREIPYALESALGGPEDQVGPRELFCAAVASSVDSTLRLIAARMDVGIERLAVIVTGDVDARGALGDLEVPAGFQSLRVEIDVALAPGQRAGAAQRLLAIAEQHCVLLQTLRHALPIEIVCR